MHFHLVFTAFLALAAALPHAEPDADPDPDADPEELELEKRDITGRCFIPGQKPMQKTWVPIEPNGCGPKFLPDEAIPDRDFVDCCNGHDRCWATCSNGRRECDQAFLGCMRKECNTLTSTIKEKKKCGRWANAYYSAVRSPVGIAAFYVASRKHCDCKW